MTMLKTNKSKRGFSMMELMIVIAVIGVLAAIIVPIFSYVVQGANRNSAIADATNASTQYLSKHLRDDKEMQVIIVESAEKFYLFGLFPDDAYEYGQQGQTLDPIPSAYNPYDPEECLAVVPEDYDECFDAMYDYFVMIHDIELTYNYDPVLSESVLSTTETTNTFSGMSDNVRIWDNARLNSAETSSEYVYVSVIDGVTNETLLYTQLLKGENVTLPSASSHLGYSFIKWVGRTRNILSQNNYVYAVYENLCTWDGVTIATGFSSGDGTEEAPYIINTAEELAYLAHTTLEDSNTYDNVFFELGRDIYLNNEQQLLSIPNYSLPIGGAYPNGDGTSTIRSFMGNFDGKNHMIFGLSVDCSNSGLFGYTDDAHISNLKLVRPHISGYNSCGAIVASFYTRDNDAIIENCTVQDATIRAYGNAGCIVGSGYSYGNDTKIIIRNCVASGVVTQTSTHTLHKTGGIAGVLQYGFVVENCVSACDITAVRLPEAAGLVGMTQCSSRFTSSYKNCIVAGTVKSTSTIDAITFIKAITPSNYTVTFENCYSLDSYNATGLTDTHTYPELITISLDQIGNEETYTGFDFSNDGDWVIDGTRFPYPEPRTARYVYLNQHYIGVCASRFSGGSGTQRSPYKISTAEQFAFLMKVAPTDATYASAYYKLTGDCIFSDLRAFSKSFTILINYYDLFEGSSTSAEHPFSGHIDGNGHTIGGIALLALTEDSGLFHYSKNATFSNIVLSDIRMDNGNVDAYIDYEALEQQSASYFTGLLSGQAENCTISNCTVNSVYIENFGTVGGLIGKAIDSTIENCIIGEHGRVLIAAYDSAAAIVGHSDGTTISHCTVINEIDIISHNDAAAIVGHGENNTLISNCYVDCWINGLMTGAGAMAGYLSDSTVEYCASVGGCLGNNSVGDIVGIAINVNLNDCYSHAYIGTAYNSDDDTEFDNFGGIFGYCEGGSITNCYTFAGFYMPYVYDNYTTNCGITYGSCPSGMEPAIQNVYVFEYAYSEQDASYYGILNKGATVMSTTPINGISPEIQPENYVGFDFDHIWIIDPDALTLPELRSNRHRM